MIHRYTSILLTDTAPADTIRVTREDEEGICIDFKPEDKRGLVDLSIGLTMSHAKNLYEQLGKVLGAKCFHADDAAELDS